MERPKVLVIEDEGDIAELIRFNLSLAGYDPTICHSGLEGLNAARLYKPNVIVLDLMLPEINGLEICKRLKSQDSTKNIPIIMVTAKSEDTDVVQGLEIGADDYLAKPFSPQILVARVNALYRRFQTDEDRSKKVLMENLLIDPGKFEVTLDGSKISLTRSEFDILHLLAQKPGWVYSRGQIVDSIRGENYAVTERSIDFQMVGLRKKLGKASEYIETVRGVGYRFRETS